VASKKPQHETVKAYAHLEADAARDYQAVGHGDRGLLARLAIYALLGAPEDRMNEALRLMRLLRATHEDSLLSQDVAYRLMIGELDANEAFAELQRTRPD
jgi:hypothetical protein